MTFMSNDDVPQDDDDAEDEEDAGSTETKQRPRRSTAQRDTTDGASDHAAIFYEYYADPDDDEPTLTLLIWNAQDWKGKDPVRGSALQGMLNELRPDVVVLLETGTAKKPNASVANHITQDYCAPVTLKTDAFSSQNDKGMVYFHKNDLNVEADPFPRQKNERRPLLLMKAKGVSFGVLHAIAERHAAAKQVRKLLDENPDLPFLCGDMNHDNKEMDGFEVVSTGMRTHFSTSNFTDKALDYAYFRSETGGRWTATRIAETVIDKQHRFVWKGRKYEREYQEMGSTPSSSQSPSESKEKPKRRQFVRVRRKKDSDRTTKDTGDDTANSGNDAAPPDSGNADKAKRGVKRKHAQALHGMLANSSGNQTSSDHDLDDSESTSSDDDLDDSKSTSSDDDQDDRKMKDDDTGSSSSGKKASARASSSKGASSGLNLGQDVNSPQKSRRKKTPTPAQQASSGRSRSRSTNGRKRRKLSPPKSTKK